MRALIIAGPLNEEDLAELSHRRTAAAGLDSVVAAAAVDSR